MTVDFPSYLFFFFWKYCYDVWNNALKRWSYRHYDQNYNKLYYIIFRLYNIISVTFKYVIDIHEALSKDL